MKSSSLWTMAGAMAFTSLSATANAQADLQCPGIARTLKEFSISTSSSSYLNSVFDSYCDSTGTKKSSSGSIGLDTVVKAIPIQFTGNTASSDEGMTNFCRTYASVATSQERKFTQQEKMASKALDTVTECLRLQSKGVVITHDFVNLERATFFLQSSINQKVTLSGVAITGKVTCQGQVAGALRQFNESTNLVVSKTQNFACKREPSTTGPGKVLVFDEATITVATDYGNYDVLWPREERLPEDQAASVALAIQALDSEVKLTKSSLLSTQDRLRTFAGATPDFWNIPNNNIESQMHLCPDGQVLVGMQVASREGNAAILALNGYCRRLLP